MFGYKSFGIILALMSGQQKFFECNFKLNDCGITNGPDMTTRFAYGRTKLATRDQNMMYLDVSTAKTPGARLITPFYETYGEIYGCLTIEWYSSGVGQQSLSVTQQDKRDRKLWSSFTKSDNWQKNSINIDLREGKPRFFIQANVEPMKSGKVAIDLIRLDYHKC